MKRVYLQAWTLTESEFWTYFLTVVGVGSLPLTDITTHAERHTIIGGFIGGGGGGAGANLSEAAPARPRRRLYRGACARTREGGQVLMRIE